MVPELFTQMGQTGQLKSAQVGTSYFDESQESFLGDVGVSVQVDGDEVFDVALGYILSENLVVESILLTSGQVAEAREASEEVHETLAGQFGCGDVQLLEVTLFPFDCHDVFVLKGSVLHQECPEPFAPLEQ